MIENPYESPRAAEPLAAQTDSPVFKYLGVIEYMIVFGYAVLIFGALIVRINSHVQLIARDRLQMGLDIGLLVTLTLVTGTGLRGLYFVLRRNQKLAVINGMLCVMGFPLVVLLGLLVMTE